MDETLNRIIECMGCKRGAQKELADHLGIHPNVITNWKNGGNKNWRGYLSEADRRIGASIEFGSAGKALS